MFLSCCPLLCLQYLAFPQPPIPPTNTSIPAFVTLWPFLVPPAFPLPAGAGAKMESKYVLCVQIDRQTTYFLDLHLLISTHCHLVSVLHLLELLGTNGDTCSPVMREDIVLANKGGWDWIWFKWEMVQIRDRQGQTYILLQHILQVFYCNRGSEFCILELEFYISDHFFFSHESHLIYCRVYKWKHNTKSKRGAVQAGPDQNHSRHHNHSKYHFYTTSTCYEGNHVVFSMQLCTFPGNCAPTTW